MRLLATSPSAALRAALIFAPTSDVRYYLNGVRFECTGAGEVYVVATDGNALFAHRELKAETHAPGPWAVTIPAAALAQLLKPKPPVVQLFETDAGFAIADGVGSTVAFKPVEDVYPDWRRLLPRKTTGETALYSTDYLVKAGKALSIVDGVVGAGASYHGQLHQNGEAPGVAVGKTPNTVVAISVRRITQKNPMSPDWFVPASFVAKAGESLEDLA